MHVHTPKVDDALFADRYVAAAMFPFVVQVAMAKIEVLVEADLG